MLYRPFRRNRAVLAQHQLKESVNEQERIQQTKLEDNSRHEMKELQGNEPEETLVRLAADELLQHQVVGSFPVVVEQPRHEAYGAHIEMQPENIRQKSQFQARPLETQLAEMQSRMQRKLLLVSLHLSAYLLI